MFNVYTNTILIISIISMILSFIIIGYLDVKYGVYDKEQSLNNQYNPELKRLLKK